MARGFELGTFIPKRPCPMRSTRHELGGSGFVTRREEERQCQLKHDSVWTADCKDHLQWWDNRNNKAGCAHPDIKRKISKQSLWMTNHPFWISEEIKTRALASPLHPQDADLSEQQQNGVNGKAQEVSFLLASLKACTKNKDLHSGDCLHNHIIKRGLLVQCVDALVTMYAKCGACSKAKDLLCMHKCENVVSWTALIAEYARQGKGQDALICFEQMQCDGLRADAVTFACALKACGSIKAIEKGEQIHNEIARHGLLEKDIVLGIALVDMYARCGALTKARQVLQQLPSRNVVCWNALITGYAHQCQGEQALNCFENMQLDGVSPNAVTYTCLLKACGSIKALEKGEQIHDEISKQDLLGDNIVLGTALVDMYAKCGALSKALDVLEALPSRNVISWNALIAGYAQQGQGDQAISCFDKMQQEGLCPDAVTFTCILKACGTIGAIDKGEQVHDQMAKQGLPGNNLVLGNALVDMYVECGVLSKARVVLEELSCRDVVSWNVLIAGYANEGQGEEALTCFEQMQQQGLSPDAVTLSCILKACGTIGAIGKGEEIHDKIARQGLLTTASVLGNALVDMYAKCGAPAKAQQVLEELPSRDVITWSAVIAGYAELGQGEQALNCFKRMQCEGLSPDAVTFTCILKACASIGAVERGEEIHEEITRKELLRDNIMVGNALVDMYAKCGALAKAKQVLDSLSVRDVVSWSALIAGYAQQGQCEQALSCFKQMQYEGISPDAVTISCVLSACCHLGLVEDGYTYFANMSSKYGIKPDLEHYTSMVDLFGRAGHLDQAVRVIQEMPSSDYYVVWSALLGACQKWRDVNVGRWAFEQAVQVDKSEAAAYVLMTNIYTAAGMRKDAENIEALRMANKAWTNASCCFTYFKNRLVKSSVQICKPPL